MLVLEKGLEQSELIRNSSHTGVRTVENEVFSKKTLQTKRKEEEQDKIWEVFWGGE